MKKILFAAAIFLSINALATNEPVSEKVLKAFNQLFSTAKDVVWSEDGNNYTAYFKLDNITTRVTYDQNGNITKTLRSYFEDNLPLNIKEKLKKNYPDKKVFGVTELTIDGQLLYNIILQNDKIWMIVDSDSNGNMQVSKKMKKA
jgi:YD repeat-containing protein